MATIKKYNGSSWENAVVRKFGIATEAVENPLYSDGTAITAYTIKGNTVQNGTPTPANPIEVNGVGVRTWNLWDGAIGLDNTRINRTNGTTVADPNYALSDYIPVSASTSYVYSFRHNQYEPNRTSFTVSFYKSNKQLVQEIALQHINDEGAIAIPFTTPANTAYIRINWKKTYDDMLMLSLGSTAKPFEPYGYKIPISSGGVTTNIYLGSTQTVRQVKKVVVDGTESTWQEYNNLNLLRLPDTSWDYRSQVGGALCDSLPLVARGDLTANSFCWSTGTIGELIININNYNLADLKTYLSSNPITIWYVLATAETAAVNEPLMKIGDYADTLSNAASIPTTEGANSITVDTTVQLSEFTATWTGWHDAAVKEWNDSQWN